MTKLLKKFLSLFKPNAQKSKADHATDSSENLSRNEKRLPIVKFFRLNVINDQTTNISMKNIRKIPDIYSEKINRLRSGIIEFFKTQYNIDVTEKIQKQEVMIARFCLPNGGISMAMGRVSTNKDAQHIVYLNQMLLLPKYMHIFNNVYVHETLHQLGISDKECMRLIDGITDAFTEMIVQSMGLQSFATPDYEIYRAIGYQFIKADKDLPRLFFNSENFHIAQRINQVLKDYDQPYLVVDNLGLYLEDLLAILKSFQDGLNKTEPVDWYKFDTQSIVNAYCDAMPITEAESEEISIYNISHNYGELSSLAGFYFMENYQPGM